MPHRWAVAVTAMVIGVAAAVIVPPRPALAACHRFDISVNPTTVGEGATVTVTVARDAGVNPSSIDVSSVNETATAGQDFPAVQRTVSMTTETEQSFPVAITDDTAPEGAETFRLHMSNPGGCAVNPRFQVGPDARVTIGTSDPLPAATVTTAPTTTARPLGAATTRPSTTTSPPPSSTTSTTPPTTTEATLALTEEDDDGGSGAAAALLGAAAVAVAGGIGYLIYRRRRLVQP